MADTAIEQYNEEVRVQRLVGVLECQVESHCSIREACDTTGLPESTFYAWLKKGALDDYLAQAKESRVSVIQGQATLALTDVMKYMVELATGTKEARGASPIRAAELVLKIAGVSAHTGVPGVAPSVNILNLLPQQVNFGRMVEGRPTLDDQGRIVVPVEVIEGEVIEAKD